MKEKKPNEVKIDEKLEKELANISLSPTYDKLSGWKGRFQDINERLVSVEMAALYICLYLMCLGAFAQWFLRVFFTVGYIWIGDLTKYAMLWTGFLGACIATSRLEHFKIDLVRLIKNERITKILRIISYTIAFIFCVIFAIATIKYLSTLIRCDERSQYYGYKIWPFYSIVLYFYVSSAFRFIMTAVMKFV